MNSYIQLGLDLGLLEKIDISLGGQKFTGYGIFDKSPIAVGLSGLHKYAEDMGVHLTLEDTPPSSSITKPDAPIIDIDAIAASSGKNEPINTPTQEQLDAQAALARMTGQAPPAEPKKRGRPRKNKDITVVSISASTEPISGTDPKVEPPAVAVSSPAVAPTPAPVIAESKTEAQWKEPAPQPVAETPKPVIDGLPTPEQTKVFREKLTHLADDILPAAGLVPSQGIGGVRMKIKLFVTKMFPGVTDTKNLTADQWKELLTFMEDYIEKTTGGAAALVNHINKEIGA